MDNLKIISDEYLNKIAELRVGEKKLYQSINYLKNPTNLLHKINNPQIEFVLFGIKEDIGIRANHGRPGAKETWNEVLKKLLNIQNNEFLNGSNILLQQLQETKDTLKVGITPVNKTMLRNNMILHNKDKNEIGYITSGCFSPILKRSIGIGYINNFTNKLDKIFVKVRGEFEEVIIDNIPFVKKNYKKGG